MADDQGCPACGGHGVSATIAAQDLRHGKAGEFTVASCPSCGTGRTLPALDDVSEWYPDTYQNFLARDSAFDRIFIRAARGYAHGGGARRRALAALIPACDLGGPLRPGASVLDVGAGSGHMVGALCGVGIDAWGVEPSAQAVRHAQARGVTTVEQGVLSTFAEAHPDRRWDVIRLWHTLEHMPHPSTDLALARQLLRTSGRVVIGVPNFGGQMSRMTGPEWDGLEVPRHYTHFTAKGLATLMHRSGLTVRSVRTVAVMGVTPASVLNRIGRPSFPSVPMMVLAHPVEVALAALGRGDGLLAIGQPYEAAG